MTKKMLALILISSLSLTSCFGGDDIELTDENTYQTADFAIYVPTDWDTLTKADFTSNVPASTLVAFRSNIKNDIFTANLTVNNTSVSEGLSSDDFGKSSLALDKQSLLEFTEILSEPYESDSFTGYELQFEGKVSASEPIVHFRQLYIVDGTNGYSISAGYLVNEDESVVNATNEMLNSFSLK